VALAVVTTVSGNVWAAESASYIGEIAGSLGRPEIQAHVGAQLPLVHTPAMSKLEGPLEFDGAFGRSLKLADGNGSAAIEALAAAVRQYPGQVTILALGPMTNIAMLLKLHPDLETKIKRIVFMGGNVHVPGNASAAAEFNFWF